MRKNNVIVMGENVVEMAQTLAIVMGEKSTARNVESVDILLALMDNQLVEVPLVIELDDGKQLRNQGDGAIGNRGKWKRVGGKVGPSLNVDKSNQGKRKCSITILED